MARVKNPYGKTAPQSAPYFTLARDGWEWRVLKLYKGAAASLTDPYARAFCAVRSPHTFGSFELGDVYVNDIPGLRLSLLATLGDTSAEIAADKAREHAQEQRAEGNATRGDSA